MARLDPVLALRLVLDPDLPDGVVRGTIAVEGGAPKPFSGWAELMALVTEARAERSRNRAEPLP